MNKPAMDVISGSAIDPIQQPSTSAVLPGTTPRGPLEPAGGLELRFVTRMSRDLGAAVAEAAKTDGLTAGAWVRRLIMERLSLRSRVDYRSGRPVHRPAADTVALVAALRELVSVGHALSCRDVPAAKASLAAARETILPLVAGGPGR